MSSRQQPDGLNSLVLDERRGRLVEVIDRLPPADQDLLDRYYWRTERLKDVAAELGTTLDSTKNRLRRIRARLRRRLGSW